jgi:hypothetical protein
MAVKIIVTGSRDCSDEDFIFETLSNLYEEMDAEDEFIVVHGGARGADSIAGRWVRIMQDDYRVFEEVFLANWDLYGKAAGHMRNAEMVNNGADLVVAFPKDGAGNRGTNNCIATAMKAGIPVRVFTEEA